MDKVPIDCHQFSSIHNARRASETTPIMEVDQQYGCKPREIICSNSRADASMTLMTPTLPSEAGFEMVQNALYPDFSIEEC
jgi:hypothetical protein